MIEKTHPPASESRKARPSSDILAHCQIALGKISLTTVTKSSNLDEMAMQRRGGEITGAVVYTDVCGQLNS